MLRNIHRCIELDCFDGPPPQAEPVVYHKFSATSKVALREVFEAIRDTAFPGPHAASGWHYCSHRLALLFTPVGTAVHRCCTNTERVLMLWGDNQLDGFMLALAVL